MKLTHTIPPSAGMGRTGVFISLSIVLERTQYEGVVDVFQTVRTLRTQRPAMVQTEVSDALLFLDIHFMFLYFLADPGGARGLLYKQLCN